MKGENNVKYNYYKRFYKISIQYYYKFSGYYFDEKSLSNKALYASYDIPSRL